MPKFFGEGGKNPGELFTDVGTAKDGNEAIVDSPGCLDYIRITEQPLPAEDNEDGWDKRVADIEKALADVKKDLINRIEKKARDEVRGITSSFNEEDFSILLGYKKKILGGLKIALNEYFGNLKTARYKLDAEIKIMKEREKESSEEVTFAGQGQKDESELAKLQKERDRVTDKASALRNRWDDVVEELERLK